MKAPPPPQVTERNKKRRGSAAPLVLVFLGLLVLAALAWASYSLLQERQNVPNIAVPNLVGKDLDAARDMVGDDFKLGVTSVDGERAVDTILSQDPSTGKADKGSEISVTVVGRQVAQVPNVVGSERAAAEQELRDAGFEVQVDERESSLDEEGMVMSQKPGGGDQIEVGSGVTITVGTGPPLVQVPDLFGTTRAQARSILDEAGLQLGSTSRDYNDEVAEGVIYFQDPAGGESVDPETAVNLTISLGAEQVQVPEVYGLSVAEAQATLSDVGLDSTAVEVPGDEQAGIALETDPVAGTPMEFGSTVTLYFSAGPPPVTTTPPEATTPPEPETPEDQAPPDATEQPDPSSSPDASAPPDPPEDQASPEPGQGSQDEGTGNAGQPGDSGPSGPGGGNSGPGSGGNGGGGGNSGPGGGGNNGSGGGGRAQDSKETEE